MDHRASKLKIHRHKTLSIYFFLMHEYQLACFNWISFILTKSLYIRTTSPPKNMTRWTILTHKRLGESQGQGATAVPALTGGPQDDEPRAHRLVNVHIGALRLRQGVGWRLGSIDGHITLQGNAHAGQTGWPGENGTQESRGQHAIAAPQIVGLLGPAAVELPEEILQIVNILVGGEHTVRIALEDLVIAGIDVVEVAQINGLQLIAAKGYGRALWLMAPLALIVLRWETTTALLALQPDALHIGARPTAEILQLVERIAHQARLVVELGQLWECDIL